uniref:Transient receptor potential cation channel subfamily A member 1 homolog n=1 Tax=Hirondellea gigas TaxID=1518452 RepID=A0A6A7G2P1_9CRUS
MDIKDKLCCCCPTGQGRVAAAPAATKVGTMGCPTPTTQGMQMEHLTKIANSRFFLFRGMSDALPAQSITQAVLKKDCDMLQRLVNASITEDILKETNKNLLLHKAVNANSPEVLKILLTAVGTEAISLHDSVHKRKTALHCAVEAKSMECIEAILSFDKSALIAKDCVENTPLHYIVKHKFLEGCVKMMEYCEPAYINQSNLKSFTPVHDAANTHNCTTILELLLSNGGKANARTNTRYTPLHLAASNGFKDSVRILLSEIQEDRRKDYMDSQTSTGFTALMFAACKGYSKACYLLSESNVNLQDNRNSTALHYAASKSYLSIVEFLMDRNANTKLKNIDGRTALYCAASSNNERCLLYLLDRTSDQETPQDLLKIATLKGNIKGLQALLERPNIKQLINYPFPDSDNNTLLHLSINKGYYKVTQLLLDNEADKNVINRLKEYPLHLAAGQTMLLTRFNEEERLEVCKEIMTHSDDLVNAENLKCETPLHLAAKSGNIDMVRSFLMKNSQILALDNYGRTTIHVAAKWGRETCLKKLLKSLGKGKTELADMMPHPLHLAAEYGHLGCCKIIIDILKEKTLTALSRDDNEEFPVDVAYRKNEVQVFEYLLGRMSFDEQQDGLCARLHQYCKDCILEDKLEMLEAIIGSTWCRVAFDGYYCANLREPVQNLEPSVYFTPCQSFCQLVDRHPTLACRAMDGHVVTLSNGQERHVYTPFEFIYYNAPDGIVERPFCEATYSSDPSEVAHSVIPSAREFKGVQWGRDHPLLMASTPRHTEVLTHPLTKSWLLQKEYAVRILYLYMLFDFLTAVAATFMLSYTWTSQLLSDTFKGATMEEVRYVYTNMESADAPGAANCSSYIETEPNIFSDREVQDYVFPGSAVWQRSLCVILRLEDPELRVWAWSSRVLVTVCWVTHLILACILIKLDKWNKLSEVRSWASYVLQMFLRNITMFLRFFCLFFVLLPFPYFWHDIMLSLKTDTFWQFGVVAVLASWLSLVATLNKIPNLRVFMPITLSFALNYLKLLMHIAFIILAFAVSFHFLLGYNKAFSNLWYSLIKTLVWMLGDLGYDDMFLQEDSPPPFPVQSNIIFVVFVTIIGGLAFNIILKNPNDQLEDIRALAEFYQAEGALKVILLIDDCVPSFRRKYARQENEIMKKVFRLVPGGVRYSSLSNQPRSSSEEDNNTIEALKLKEQNEQLIEKIDNLQQDLQDLSRKMITFINAHPETNTNI